MLGVAATYCDLSPRIAVSQEQNRSAEEFSQRTDHLAQALGVPLNALESFTKISPRMLYAYRGAKNRVTAKAWAKLRSAEIAAGIVPANEIGERSTTGDLAVGEDEQAPYGTPEMLEREARQFFERVISAAKGDTVRLGWLMQQMIDYLSPPKSWHTVPKKLVRVTLPSQTQRLSSETGLPLPDEQPSRRARPA